MSHSIPSLAQLGPDRISASTEQSGVQSEFIAGPFPDSLWIQLESLYASVFSSRVLLWTHCSAELSASPAHAWVEHTDGQLSALLVFILDGPVVRVLNEVVSLSASVIRRFASAVFASYQDARLVQLHAIFLQQQPGMPPLLSSIFSEDYVLDLPASSTVWQASLSRQAREKVRYHIRRSFRRQPALEFTVTAGANIDESEIIAVLRLNRHRMEKKGKSYAMSDAEESQLSTQMRQAGRLFALRLDGEICAGLLCSVTGGDVYMHVIAHDPAHDDLRLGLVCCALAIQHSIELQLARFHFLWGHYDYKRRLGGRARPLSRVLVPKDSWQLFLHPMHSSHWFLNAARDTARRWRRPAISREVAC